MTDAVTSTSASGIERDLETALKSLSLADQKAVLALHNNFPDEKNLQFYGIIRSNAYPLGLRAEHGGLFAQIARINHSYLPNTVQYWNELLGKQTIML